jgi:succinate dehydrogenase/fumarate reductase-like Fe-S protein
MLLHKELEMSAWKDLIVDVTELYDAGAEVYEIAKQLELDTEIVEQVLCYIDEERYHEDMKRNPWQGLVA